MTILNLKQAYCKLDKDQRFYRLERPIIGITGGIATGKSTCSKYLISEGYPLLDADRLVKLIYSENETIEFIKGLKSTYVTQSQIDFIQLRQDVFNDQKLKQIIENYIYQRLPMAFEKELIKLEPAGALFYDIPLLFEKKLQDQFDITICIFSKPETQLDRLINRDGISEDGAQKILKAQMPIDEKADLADFVIDNNNDKSSLFNNIKNLIQEISA